MNCIDQVFLLMIVGAVCGLGSAALYHVGGRRGL